MSFSSSLCCAADSVLSLFRPLPTSPSPSSSPDTQFLPVLHRPSSITLWNGTSIAFEVLPDYLSKLPMSRHEVQTIDVHPILGVCTSSPSPSFRLHSADGLHLFHPPAPAPMQVLITGSVIYFNPSTDPSLPADKQALPPMGPTELKKFKEKDDVERLPRAFHSSFVLTQEESGKVHFLFESFLLFFISRPVTDAWCLGLQYFIGSSMYRFVG